MKTIRTFREFRESNRKIYCDLDGVLADFERGAKELADADPARDSKEEMWEKIKQVDSFYYRLPLMPDALELWEHITKNQNPHILSVAPRLESITSAEQDKIAWVQENLYKYDQIIIVDESADKAAYAQNYGGSNVLIDDREKSIKPWIQNGGTGVHHTSAADSIQKLQQYGVT